MIGIIIVIICVIVIFWIFASKYKCIKAGNLVQFCGGVKTGKSQVCVREVFKRYNCQRLKWKIKSFLCKITKKETPEEPLIYSNVPIGKKGFNKLVPLTFDLLTLKKRFRYGSIIYICEASLVNSCMDIRDDEVNDILTQLYKLIAHETQGGYMYLDTQNPLDIHFGPKRSISTYYQIFHRDPIKILGFEFFAILQMREMLLNAGDKSEKVENDDPQDAHNGGTKGTYWHIISRKWFKYYDRYCYSALTDNLEVEDRCVMVSDNKKAKNVLSIKNYIKKKRLEEKTK